MEGVRIQVRYAQEAAAAPGFAWDAGAAAAEATGSSEPPSMARDDGALSRRGTTAHDDAAVGRLGTVQDDGAAGVGWQYAAAGSSEPPSMAAQEHHQQLHGGGVARAADSGSEGSEMQLGNQDDDGVDGGETQRGGKKQQCKNLVAERKRRKKLNDPLYKLRSLVPNITKIDTHSCTVDHIYSSSHALSRPSLASVWHRCLRG